MPNRHLTDGERASLFTPLIAEVRARLEVLSKGDRALFWALRRKLAKELTYDANVAGRCVALCSKSRSESSRQIAAPCAHRSYLSQVPYLIASKR